MRSVPGAFAVMALLVVFACGPKPPASEQPPAVSTASLDDREWILVGLGEVAAPLGAGGRPATLQFDPTAGRATGFAGCNRYSAGYTLAGDSLTFGPAISTKMACARRSPSAAPADRWRASAPTDLGDSVELELESGRATP